jgi:hypothetical protein
MIVGVWCAASTRQIIRPIFFYETVNLGWYIRYILVLFSNSWLMMKDSLAISNKTVQLHILQTTQWKHCEKCFMPKSLVQDCSLQDHLILMFVIYIFGKTLSGKCTGSNLTLLKPSTTKSGMWLLGLCSMSFSMFHRNSFDDVRCVWVLKVVTLCNVLVNSCCHTCYQVIISFLNWVLAMLGGG